MNPIDVYLIEIRVPDDGQWRAMYIPCYSKQEADRKALIKKKQLGKEFGVRVGRYAWEESYD